MSDIRTWQRKCYNHKKYILKHLNDNEIIYLSERSHRGHYMYKVDNINETCEVLPIASTSKYAGYFKNKHLIKKHSFISERIIMSMKISTEKLFYFYEEKLKYLGTDVRLRIKFNHA